MAERDFTMPRISWLRDPETVRLAAYLGIDTATAYGLRVSLRAYAATDAPLGIIPNQDVARFALAIGTRLDPDQVVAGFLHIGEVGFDTDGEGLSISGWLDSEDGQHWAKLSLRQSYRAHVRNHISFDARGEKVWSPGPTCRWCLGLASPIPVDQLGLAPETVEKGMPPRNRQRRTGGAKEAQAPPKRERERETRKSTKDENTTNPEHEVADTEARVIGKDSKGRDVWRTASGDKYVEHVGFGGETVRLAPGQEPNWDVNDPDQAPF
jgi:hypothetical protein